MTALLRQALLLYAVIPLLTQSLIGHNVAQYNSDNISPDLTKKAHAVVRSETVKLKLSKHEYTSKHEEVITVMSKKGESFLTFRQTYKEGSSEVKNIKIEVFDADGKLIKKVKSKDIEDQMSFDGFSIVTDYREKFYHYETSNYPVTIKRSYKVVSDNTYTLPMWHPVPGYNVSVEQSTYI